MDGKTLVILGVAAAALWWYMSRQQQAGMGQVINNAETWNWTDWQGRTRTVTVNRHVEASGL